MLSLIVQETTANTRTFFMQIPPASKHDRLFKIRNVNWPFYTSLLYFKWVIVECRLPAGTGSIQNSSLNKSITSSMESPVMRNLAFRLCYSIIEWLMKKTTSSLLIPKIRFPLIKCHCWKGASSDLTKVSRVPLLRMGGVVRNSSSPKINVWRGRRRWGQTCCGER